VTVHMFNPHVPDSDIVTFLRRFMDVQSEGTKIWDEEDIWTFKRRYMVRFRPSQVSSGGVLHPPANIFIGPNRDPGQPKTCRKCGQEGHLALDCKEQVCRCCSLSGEKTDVASQPASNPLGGLGENGPKEISERWVDHFEPQADVPEEDIEVFLRRFVDITAKGTKIIDRNGYWTGKIRYFVRLRTVSMQEDGFLHPPAMFFIGVNREYLNYPGQPLTCRRCVGEGHFAANCRELVCKRCGKAGHLGADCKMARTWNLCGEEGHLYKDCP
uniref:CCHC-type domain-containing protein n=1 Tax=Lepisosteus oculatus TaxID=7918 RepID=W5LX10_LEPOC